MEGTKRKGEKSWITVPVATTVSLQEMSTPLKNLELYSDGLILFINGFVNNFAVAEDLADETFFELMSGKSRYKGRCSFKTWLYKIGRNNAVDHLRR